MTMTMVVFNRLRGALDSLRASTDVSYIADCVEARVEGRQKRRLSHRTVEYRLEFSTRGEAAAWNDRHAIAFTSGHPEWPAPALAPGIMTYWVRVEVPRTLLAGLENEVLRYHGIIPWDQYSADRIVPVWVAVPVVVGWDADGRPVFQQEEPQPETEPEAEKPIVPPLEVPPPPQWPERAE